MKKKILIVCSTFHPVQSPRAFRATELVKEFSRKGHDVHVLTPLTNQSTNLGNEYRFKIHDLGNNPFKRIDIKSKNNYFYIIERILTRFLNLLFEYPDIGFYFLVKSKLKQFNNFDLLISIAFPFPVHWGVASVWKKKKISKVWVADCGDPYMGATSDTFPKAFYFHYFENKFLKLADYVSIPFDDLKHKFNVIYHNKFISIPQGFNFDYVNLKEYKKNNVLKIAYAGTVMPGYRHPVELIQYLLSKKIDFEFHFYGTNKQSFSKEFPIIKNTIFFPQIMRTDLLNELSTYDFLVNVMEKKTNNRITAIPSKLIDYYLTKRPILSYEYGSLDKSIVDEFLLSDYKNKHLDNDFDRFNISNVVERFLNLK